MGTSEKTNDAAGLESRPSGFSRRNFVKGAATAAAVAAAIPLQPLLGGKETTAEASVAEFNPTDRSNASFNFRVNTAKTEHVSVGLQADNGDADRFKDGSGSYTKALQHDALGVTNQASFHSLIEAFEHGKSEDFAEIIIGTPGGGGNSKLNGPQVALALDLEGLDSHATIVPAAPSVTSNITAAEAVEHYWGALLPDVPFTEYSGNPTVAEAVDFMNSPTKFQNIQNGREPSGAVNFDPTHRFLRNGRDLSAYTRVDVLYQAYFTAFLVMAGIAVPPNPGSPYIGAKTEKAFATLGGPDAAGTIGEMATRALKASWFHKWIKDLRMRPEEYAGIVQARLTHSTPAPQSAAHLHPDVLNSAVLPKIHAKFGSFLLPQAFPEGSPTHPCYPTGHGTVGGACITAIKFFFDCNHKLRPLLQAAG